MSVSVSAPQSRRVWPPATIAAAVSPPATTSMASSTFVTGPSCRPPPPSRAMAARTAPKASVASGSAATRGSARRPPKERGSAEAACEDTTPEPPAADAQGGRGEQADDRDQGGGHVATGARQLAEAQGPGLHELAAHVDRLGRLADLGERLALLGRGAGQRVGAARRRRARRARGAVACGAGAARGPPAAAARGAAAAVARSVLAGAEGGQAAALKHVAAGRVLVGVRRQRVERLLVLRLGVGPVDV